jgi:2-polyprenyl-6-methoxyphenol hydroxylase-like FAD-dependent oxidoreductase
MIKTGTNHIAIVGCGIAGPMLAFLLSRTGRSVTLFEQAEALEPIGAGIMLQPLGQLVLRHVGLFEEVIARAEPIHELHAVQRNGKTMIRMPFRAAGIQMHAFGVHRNDIFKTLSSKLKESNAAVQLGVTVAGTSLEHGKVSIHAQDGRVWKNFDRVVIAGGARTILRSMGKFKQRGFSYNHGAVWFNARSTRHRGKLLQVVDGTQKLMGMLPVGNDRLSLFWGIPCRVKEQFMAQPIDRWKDEVADFYPDAAHVLESIDSWEQARYGTYMNATVYPLFDEHHIFIGDAAHAMSPHLGQGLNFALLDALRFSNCLEQHSDWVNACQEYQKRQRWHLLYYRFITGLLTPFFQSDSRWKGHFRDCVLPWLHHLPWIRWQMALTMTGTKSGFFTNRFHLDS